jgi:hypothetical protein
MGQIPVVYVTGNADLFEAGDAVVVDKPISFNALAAACARVRPEH